MKHLPMLKLVGGTKPELSKLESAIVRRIALEDPRTVQDVRSALLSALAAFLFLGVLLGLLAAGTLP